jgi:hypothetical protein
VPASAAACSLSSTDPSGSSSSLATISASNVLPNIEAARSTRRTSTGSVVQVNGAARLAPQGITAGLEDGDVGMSPLQEVDELCHGAMWRATHDQDQWQPQPSRVLRYPGETLQSGGVGRIDSLEHEGRSSTGPLGELVARVHKLGIEGRAWQLTEKPTPESCF